MRVFNLSVCAAILILSVVVLPLPILAQDIPEWPDAEIVNDEGGPVVVYGEVTYTNPFFTSGVAAPIIILEDQAGFVDRNEFFIFPLESQTLGQITSDFFTSPFSYSLALPIQPQGTLRDVSQSDEELAGVMVFAVAYWTNTWGDPFLEERDMYGGGWSTAYASTRVTSDPERLREVVGGKLIVYAPDDQQGFPSGFGEDGLLFTDDDPIVRLPQGWIVVDLETEPFTFDRGRQQEIDLLEPEESALVDYSDLSFTEAFDNMVDKLSKEYAFTEYKNIDWQALSDEFRPRFEVADAQGNNRDYLNALREFLWRVPDGHVGLSPFTPFVDQFRNDIALGLGLAIRTTDDGRVLANYLLPGGPAAQAGMELGAEIIAIAGQTIEDAIVETEPWTQPFSTSHNLRLEQERFVTRYPATTRSVNLTFLNPGADTPDKVALTPVAEFESFQNALLLSPTDGFELPVEFRLLDGGQGYVAIYSFFDNTLLTVQLWERMIRQMIQANVPGIIVDLRQNGGGNGFLADQMSAYFFDEVIELGQSGSYNPDLDDFLFDPRGVRRLYLPEENMRYLGPVSVLVGPSCASACERFAYNMSLRDGAHIIGKYPTAGLGGSVSDFRMPLDMTVRFTAGRSVDMSGEIHIEGIGIAPTIAVPINERTLLADNDIELEYAIAALSGRSIVPSVDGGQIALGDAVSGTLTAGRRVRYRFQLEGGMGFDVFVEPDADDLTTVVRFYDSDGNLLLTDEDRQQPGSGGSSFFGLGAPANLEITIEIASFADAADGDFTLRLRPSE
jgi:C-terminal processing protease CtpA/Prc